jgi:hypothetical protein
MPVGWPDPPKGEPKAEPPQAPPKEEPKVDLNDERLGPEIRAELAKLNRRRPR